MPKFVPGDSIFAGFSPGETFHSDLPSSDLTKTDALVRLQNRAGLVENYLTNFGSMARITTAKIAVTAGVPSFRVEGLEKIFTQWPIAQADGSLTQVAMTTVVKGAAQIWQQALRDAMTDIPILGWVARVGYLVADLIGNIVNAYKTEKPPHVVEALVYSKERDEQAVRDMLKEAGLTDWTDYFLPISLTPSWVIQNISWGDDGRPEGRRLTTGWGGYAGDKADGWGLIPGIADRVGDYQWPRRLPRSNRDAHPQLLETWAPLFPSSVQFGLSSWQTCMKVTPQMFMLDLPKIDRAWRDWYESLWAFAQTQDAHTRRMLEYAARWAHKPPVEAGRKAHWVSKYPQFRLEAGRAQKGVTTLPSGFDKPGMQWLISYQIDVLRRRMKPALGTIMCAYVPENAPAFRNDDLLADYHREMRQLLLTHPARRFVELDLIPDPPYRAAMHQAQLAAIQDMVAPTGHLIEGAPTVDPGTSPDDLPPNPGPAVAVPDEDGLGGLEVALVIGGGLTLAYWIFG